jgi:sulfofructosephosphate aldolase
MPAPDAARTPIPTNPAGLARLARPSGAFAMLALDQRESLRTMMAAHDAEPVPDRALTEFKVAAARALTGAASAVLLDVPFGLAAVQSAGAIASGCGLIVAADRLTQEPGGPVEWTEVDDEVLSDAAIGEVADAYKFLVIWRRGEDAERERTVRAFVDGCRRHGRPAIVEGIVRAPDGRPLAPDAHVDLVIEAAVELAGYGADLYKAEVPTLGAADDETITAAAQRLTSAIPCPWVVLSNGTSADRYRGAMLAACRGGAAGFLAGRAIWTASLAADDVAEHLRTVAAPRLADLGAAVDAAVAGRSRDR